MSVSVLYACGCLYMSLCLSPHASVRIQGQVSVWFHVRVETQRLIFQSGSSVVLRGPQRLKFTLWRHSEGRTGLASLPHTHTHTHTHTNTYIHT